MRSGVGGSSFGPPRVYDHSGRNFLTTMLRLGGERQSLAVVDDQWGAPTYAPHLARTIVAALKESGAHPAGISLRCLSRL